jgi:hypothetical protein
MEFDNVHVLPRGGSVCGRLKRAVIYLVVYLESLVKLDRFSR